MTPIFKHKLKASLEDGHIIVRDNAGDEVDVQFGGTKSGSTCYASVAAADGRCFFIGGWNCQPVSRPLRFADLVHCINEGVVYNNIDDFLYGDHRRVRHLQLRQTGKVVLQ